ncbi:MAG: hypothetical protein EOP09_10800 [Proteobacteria bacterium]|nr:MAG: hypothetical protein EOP09_10800 [Pseudomonadota bacterium]
MNHGISIQNYELDPILGDTRYYTKKDLLGALESECSIQSQGQGFIFEALELKTLDSTEFPLLEINRSYARNYRLGSFSNLSARTPSILDLRSFSYSPMTTWDSGYRHWNHHAYSRIVWNEQLEESELSLKFWKPSARFGSSCRTLKRAPHADENTMPYLGTARILSQ